MSVNASLSVRYSVVVALIAAASWPGLAAQQTPYSAAAEEASAAIDGEWTRWTNGRYRITPGDVLEITFPFVPELNQTVMVQPDGYIALKDTRELRAQGRTVAQFKEEVVTVYSEFVRDPVLTVALKEFEKPYFVASGEVRQPGRFELRGATTVTQAVAMAGGYTADADTSRTVLYRRFGEAEVEAKLVNVGRMFSKKDLSEDPVLRPGDMIVVPRSMLGKTRPFLEPILNFWLWRW
jgi:protein involved in polysaccharide export with SLBB domain